MECRKQRFLAKAKSSQKSSHPKIFQNYPFPARLSKTLNARNRINLINVFAFPISNRIEGKTWMKVSKFATRHICAILGRRIS